MRYSPDAAEFMANSPCSGQDIRTRSLGRGTGFRLNGLRITKKTISISQNTASQIRIIRPGTATNANAGRATSNHTRNSPIAKPDSLDASLTAAHMIRSALL